MVQNTGGDRSKRMDDSLAEIQGKLKIFQGRTQPLCRHYKNKGIPVHQISVNVNTTPEQMVDKALQELNPTDG